MTVKYRPPYATEWEELPLEKAMDMVADRLWESREKSFEEEQDGEEGYAHDQGGSPGRRDAR